MSEIEQGTGLTIGGDSFLNTLGEDGDLLRANLDALVDTTALKDYMAEQAEKSPELTDTSARIHRTQAYLLVVALDNSILCSVNTYGLEEDGSIYQHNLDEPPATMVVQEVKPHVSVALIVGYLSEQDTNYKPGAHIVARIIAQHLEDLTTPEQPYTVVNEQRIDTAELEQQIMGIVDIVPTPAPAPSGRQLKFDPDLWPTDKIM